MTGRCRRLAVVLGTLLGAVLVARTGAAQTPAKPVAVTRVVAIPSGDGLEVIGENFGSAPFVTLNLLPLTIDEIGTNRIVVAAPVKLMPAGTYLLTVSYGPNPGETGSFQVVLGGKDAVGPAATAGAAAPPARVAASAPDLSAPGFLSAPGDIAAKVGDRTLTLADVDRQWQQSEPGGYLALTRQLYADRRRVLDTMVANELLAREAADRGISVDALLKEEIPKHVIASPDSAVVSLYESLGDLTRGATLERMQPALRAWLEKMTEPEIAKMNYVEELEKVSTRVDVLLEAPRVKVEHTPQDATLGPDNAAVVIVAFGDFQSVDYARFAQAFGKVRETFGDRVQVVFKNLPVIGPDSATAAEAGRCAAAQNKFWPFHDALVAQPGVADVVRLKQIAKTLGLDLVQFGACVDGREFGGIVQQAVEEAARYGIGTSPSFLVNGRLAPEAPAFLPPFEYFKRLIEEELRMERSPVPRR